MTVHTHQTAPTHHVETGVTCFAYRRFGSLGSGVPLMLSPPVIGAQEDWIPAITNGLAWTREVILLDSISVLGGLSEGPLLQGGDFAGFARALGLGRIDVLDVTDDGVFSQIVLHAYDKLRRLILMRASDQSRPRWRWAQHHHADVIVDLVEAILAAEDTADRTGVAMSSRPVPATTCTAGGVPLLMR